jgi:polyhydroxyalkanoate synthase
VTSPGGPPSSAPRSTGGVDVDSYVVAAADHICPWQTLPQQPAARRQDPVRPVVYLAGIAALVSPPGGKSQYQASDVTADAQAWQQSAATEQGSWWPDYASWLAARSGGQVPAPAGLGSDGYRVIEPAPGSYVRAA